MSQTPSTMLPLGTRAPSFSLPEPATGRTVSLEELGDAEALLVVFLSNHCPFVKHLRHELAAFTREYAGRGLAAVGIMSNDVETHPDDHPDRMKEEVERVGYPFPYLYDETQEAARAYQAACTPDFFLFDGERRLVYRGQFDPSRPGNDVAATGSDLRAAVDVVLAGGTPDPDGQVPSIGCNIKWKPGNEPEWFG